MQNQLLQEGDTIGENGRYTILAHKDSGGMSHCYTADDNVLKQTVYIKQLKLEHQKNSELVKRFKQEVDILKTLENERIVKVFDSFSFNEREFLSMEYIEGINLREWINNNPKPATEEIMLIAKRLCRTLSYLHKQKLVHRDIKPNNIMMTDSKEIVCIDFGLATSSNKDEAGDLTLAGGMGTKDYMPPEQKAGDREFIAYGEKEHMSCRADIYSTAVIIYELLTQERLSAENSFEEQEEKRKLKKHPKLSDSVYEVLNKALSFLPSSRYDDIEYFYYKLEESMTNKTSEDTQEKRKSKIPSVLKFTQDKQYAFTISEDSDTPMTFYFTLDKNDQPIKLGDGTFGCVFMVHDRSETKYAVKLFYKNATESAPPYYLTDDIIEKMKENFYQDSDLPEHIQFDELKNPVNDLKEFVELLKAMKLPDEQFQFLFNVAMEYDTYKRFEFESNARTNIQKKINEKKVDHQIEGLIINIGGTVRFQKYEAYQTFSPHFNKLGMQLSNYAIVMNQYDYTLKELLESGTGYFTINKAWLDKTFKANAPEKLNEIAGKKYYSKAYLTSIIDEMDTPIVTDDIKLNIIRNLEESNGYDILKNMSFNKRIQTMLPFLLSIVGGMQTLHLADMYHLDMKPANIFVKGGGKIDSVLGDLGYLGPKTMKASSVATFHNLLPLGTLHFRSPEQKDYFDICDVEITHRGNDVVLIARDPKFATTIIESNDGLVFSKDSQHTFYTIKDISIENKLQVITLDNNNENNLQDTIKPDRSTQVLFYKQQGIRTDLFGFGSIVFDMLTGGQSAEQFYNNIRNYDTKQWEVGEIMSRYEQVLLNQSNDPGLINAFKPFKHSLTNEYAPHDIVKLVLSCIMYKAQNTFYDQSDKNPVSATNKLRDEIVVLEKKHHGDAIENQLFNKKMENTDNTVKKENTLLEKIGVIQSIESKKNYPMRLISGIWYFRELVELIKNNFVSEKKQFFAQMLPNNIELYDNKVLNFSYYEYKEFDHYLKDLKEDRVYTKITRDGLNPYIPSYMTYIRHEIRLKSVGKKNIFKYYVSHTLSSIENIAVDDWIVIQKELWRIIRIENDEIEIKSYDQPDKTADISADKYFIFYHNINPCKYYFEVLGSYIYNIFFVGVEGEKEKIPKVTRLNKEYCRTYSNWNIINIDDFYQINESRHFEKLPPIEQFKWIMEFITFMYVKLIFTNNSNSYYSQNTDNSESQDEFLDSQYENNKQRILAVTKDVVVLQEYIEKFFNLQPQSLNVPINTLEKTVEKRQGAVDFSHFDFPQFKELFDSLVELVKLEEKPKYRPKKPKVVKGLMNKLSFKKKSVNK